MSRRHVCTNQRNISYPVRTKRVFCKPTYKKYMVRCGTQWCEGVRLVYEKYHKDVVADTNHTVVDYTCCPGWTQVNWRSHGCNKPVCSTPCQHGGKCVKPNICSCPPGYGGTFCETKTSIYSSNDCCNPCAVGPCSSSCLNGCPFFPGSCSPSGCNPCSNSCPITNTCPPTCPPGCSAPYPPPCPVACSAPCPPACSMSCPSACPPTCPPSLCPNMRCPPTMPGLPAKPDCSTKPDCPTYVCPTCCPYCFCLCPRVPEYGMCCTCVSLLCEGKDGVERTDSNCSPECQNGGTCSSTASCTCPAGFTGEQCEKDVDECKEKPCDQICYNNPGSYKCECKENFVLQKDGQTCRKETDDGALEARDLEQQRLDKMDKRLQKLEKIMKEKSKNEITQQELTKIYSNIDKMSNDINRISSRLTRLESNGCDIEELKSKISIIDQRIENFVSQNGCRSSRHKSTDSSKLQVNQ